MDMPLLDERRFARLAGALAASGSARAHTRYGKTDIARSLQQLDLPGVHRL